MNGELELDYVDSLRQTIDKQRDELRALRKEQTGWLAAKITAARKAGESALAEYALQHPERFDDSLLWVDTEMWNAQRNDVDRLRQHRMWLLYAVIFELAVILGVVLF